MSPAYKILHPFTCVLINLRDNRKLRPDARAREEQSSFTCNSCNNVKHLMFILEMVAISTNNPHSQQVLSSVWLTFGQLNSDVDHKRKQLTALSDITVSHWWDCFLCFFLDRIHVIIDITAMYQILGTILGKIKPCLARFTCKRFVSPGKKAT